MNAMNTQVTFTEAAASKVASILADEESAKALRVFVKGGGCSGFQYGFSLEETVEEDDFEFETNGVKLIVDAMSMQYLEDATIDYVETLSGSNFSISNPNSVSKCGCGSSFAV